ncbi:MAG: ROK family protein [Thermomicrobium sp.]|nr:ROK family protein [Thermomicrobium sp.]MDW7982386.1 ROK family protein [Thermomicrobium sp.]
MLELTVRRFRSRPPTASDRVLGLAIAGGSLRAVVADGTGRILGEAAEPLANLDAPAVLRRLTQLADQALANADLAHVGVKAVGIAFGGPVDPIRGLTLLSPRSPGFEQYPLAALIEERLGVPTVLENDARAAAFGEAVFGAARGCQTVVYLHLGTGVGGGIIIDGRLVYGASNTAGEIGHIVVTAGGPTCSCGKPGHLEAYASEPALVARVWEALLLVPNDPGHQLFTSHCTAPRLFEFARLSPTIRQVLDDTIHVLALAISTLIATLNPDAVVLGGPVAEAGQDLLEPLQARVRQFAYPASLRRVRVALAELGRDAPVIGAVALALART